MAKKTSPAHDAVDGGNEGVTARDGELVMAEAEISPAQAMKERFPTEDDFATAFLELEATVARLSEKVFGKASK